MLLKMSAADLDNIKQSPELTTKLQPLQYGTLFTLRLKTRIESYEGQPRQKTSVAADGEPRTLRIEALRGSLDWLGSRFFTQLLVRPSNVRRLQHNVFDPPLALFVLLFTPAVELLQHRGGGAEGASDAPGALRLLTL